jgi:hypothetical protein
MWWKAYGDTQPKFVKAWNSRKKATREPLTDEIERMAWNYHYTYLYSQVIYEWSEGYGRLEVITKEHPPTGCRLPKLIETDKNKPINPDVLKQRYNLDRQSYMTAAVDLFSNPFVPSVFLPEKKDPVLAEREAEERLLSFKNNKEVKEQTMQLSLF